MPHLQKVYDAAGKSKLDVYAIDIKDENSDAMRVSPAGATALTPMPYCRLSCASERVNPWIAALAAE